MSFFHSDPKSKPESDKNEKSDDRVFLVIIVCLVLGGAGYKIERMLDWIQFRYFEPIHMGLYALTAVGLAIAALYFSKHTKNLETRVAKLKSIWDSSSGILVGKTAHSGVDLFAPEKARCGQVEIIAATGRGKTESVILPWSVRDILNGHNVVLLDGKGDPEIVEKIRDAIQYFPNKPELVVFDLGNPLTSCTTNPLQYGSPQQIVDRIFTALEFKDEYYQAVQYDIAGAAVELIQEVDSVDGVNCGARSPGIVTFRRLYEVLTDQTTLSELIAKSKNEALKKLLMREYVSVNAKDKPQLLKGLISQMGPFATREVAPLVNGPVEGRPHCTISDAILSEASDTQKLYVFLIPTLKYQKLGHQLGKLLLQELGWAVGERASRMGASAPFTPVYLDEFSAFVYDGFENILNKARSSRVALHLSHQAIGDFTKISDSLAEIINVNTNVKCILGVNDPKTAEFFAKHIGTQRSEKLTEKAENRNLFGLKRKTGDLSLREVEEFIIHPNQLKNYTSGMGVLHMPGPQGNITEEVQFLSLENRELKSRNGGFASW
jgi:hypothetical protein